MQPKRKAKLTKLFKDMVRSLNALSFGGNSEGTSWVGIAFLLRFTESRHFYHPWLGRYFKSLQQIDSF